MKSELDKLVIKCEYEMINSSTNSVNEKVTYRLDDYFLHTILLVVICSFLLRPLLITVTT